MFRVLHVFDSSYYIVILMEIDSVSILKCVELLIVVLAYLIGIGGFQTLTRVRFVEHEHCTWYGETCASTDSPERLHGGLVLILKYRYIETRIYL